MSETQYAYIVSQVYISYSIENSFSVKRIQL